METVFLLEISEEVVPSDHLFWSPGGFHLTTDPSRGLIPHDHVRRIDINRVLYRVRATNETFRPDQVMRCANGYLIVNTRQFLSPSSVGIELLPEHPKITAITERISMQPPAATAPPRLSTDERWVSLSDPISLPGAPPLVRPAPPSQRNSYDELMSVIGAPPGERAARRQELSRRSGQILNPFGGISPERLVQRSPLQVSADSDLDLPESDPPDTSSSIAEAGFPGIR